MNGNPTHLLTTSRCKLLTHSLTLKRRKSICSLSTNMASRYMYLLFTFSRAGTCNNSTNGVQVHVLTHLTASRDMYLLFTFSGRPDTCTNSTNGVKVHELTQLTASRYMYLLFTFSGRPGTGTLNKRRPGTCTYLYLLRTFRYMCLLLAFSERLDT